MQVHLVDGTYELFRNWFGAPPRRAPDGREVGATVGLVRTLGALLRDPGVTHVGVAFDHVIESFRNELFVGYKTSEGVPQERLAQFEPAERAARAMGVVVWPMIEFEADYAIATAAARAAADPRVERVVICSPDKDFAQCVEGNRIVCLDRRRRSVLDEAGVVAKFGVPPSSIPDWLALVGDDADGIPGIAGFGAKTAAALLARWRTIDAIPDDPRTWPPSVRSAPGLAAALRAQRAESRLYKTLATLRMDVPLAESVDDLEWHGPPADALDTLKRELGIEP